MYHTDHTGPAAAGERMRNRSESNERNKSGGKKCTAREPFHGVANENAQKIVGLPSASVFCSCTYCVYLQHLSKPITIWNLPADAIAVTPRPMEIAHDSRTFFTPPPCSPRRDVRSPLARFILFVYPSVSMQIISYRSLHL